jgi:hypothetical protein
VFQTEVRDDYSFVSWLTQQIAAVAIPLALAGITAGTITDYFNQGFGFPMGIFGEVVWYTFFVWGNGLYLALLVHRFFPRAATEGCWVWAVPMFFFLLAFIWDALMSSLPHVLTEFFYPGPNGESGWALMLITYPTWQAVLYSLGMFYASRRRRRRDIASLPTPVEN